MGTRKAILVALAVVALLATDIRDAEAKFGVGVSVGTPTGLTAEFGVRGRQQGRGLGQSFELTVGEDTYAHSMWKVYATNIARSPAFKLPLYLGLGPFASNANGDQLRLGARVPMGIAFEFRRAPAHLFFEVALNMEVSPQTFTSFQGAAGFRWFF
jgi:hypothetical protein